VHHVGILYEVQTVHKNSFILQIQFWELTFYIYSLHGVFTETESGTLITVQIMESEFQYVTYSLSVQCKMCIAVRW